MITVNKNTTQTPLTSPGRTGTQTLKLIPAPRVYIGPPDYSENPSTVFGMSNGNTPLAFVDLGVVEGTAAVAIGRKINSVDTGLDKVVRGAYAESIRGGVSFTLSQFDDVALEQVSGIAPSSTIPGIYAAYQLGTADLNPVSLLLVIQNKLDGKEFQFYNPYALLSFTIENEQDAMVLKVAGVLPGFKDASGLTNQILSLTILSNQVPGYGYYGYGYVYGA